MPSSGCLSQLIIFVLWSLSVQSPSHCNGQWETNLACLRLGHNGYHNSVQVARMQSWSYILLIVLHWKTFLFPLSHDHTPSQPDPNESLKVSVTFLVCLFVPYLLFTAYKILWSLPFPHLYTLYTPLVLRASLGLMVVLFVFCLKLTACLKSINTQDITL